MRLPPCLVAVIYVTDPPSCVYLCVLLPLHTSETYLAVSTSVSCCRYILYRPTSMCLLPYLVAVTYFADLLGWTYVPVLLQLQLRTLQIFLAMSTCFVAVAYFTDHPSGLFGGWAAKKMLDGQRQRMDIPAYARTARNGLLPKRLEEDLCWIVPHVLWRPRRSREWTELVVCNFFFWP